MREVRRYALAMPHDPVPRDKASAAREMERLIAQGTSRDPAWFSFGDRVLTPSDVVALLDPYVTEERKQRIEAVLDERTYQVAVVVEGMVDTGNVAAVQRSTDGFGIQSFHAIDTAGTYKHSKRTAQGAHKWLDRYRWRDAASCVGFLHDHGYTVVAAHVDPGAGPIDAVDFTRRTALVFGNELAGVSPALLDLVDATAHIPISGFVESYNISVAAGVALYQARHMRIDELGSHGDLSAADRERLRAVFWLKSVKHHRRLMERLMADGPRSGATVRNVPATDPPG